MSKIFRGIGDFQSPLFSAVLTVFMWLGSTACAERVLKVSPDGPLRSLAEARDEIRKLQGDEAVRVIVGEGVYPISTAIVFTPQDSGTAQAPVIYDAAPGARPVISGGRVIGGFTVQRDGTWTTNVDPEWQFEQFWVNGRRAVRAREPDTFFYYLRNGREVMGKTEGPNPRPIARQTLYADPNELSTLRVAYSSEYQLKRSRVEDHLSFTLERNVIAWDSGDLFHGSWSDDKVKLGHNLYWRSDGQPIDFNGMSFEQWQATGKDASSIVTDPLFVDAAHDDFRLREDSPAKKIGFVPFDASKAGVYGDPQWVAKAKRLTFPEMKLPPPTPVLAFHEDFEAGELPVATSVSQEANRPGIEVVETPTAKSGRYALRMTDSPQQSHRYYPMFVVSPAHAEGVSRCAFAIKLGAGAVFQHEWRDRSQPYRVGPTLWIENGKLRAANRELLTLPENEWIEIEIATPLGEAAGLWDLVVTLPDAAPQRFEKLPTGHKEWRTLDWLGFISQADADAVVWIDDLELRQ